MTRTARPPKKTRLQNAILGVLALVSLVSVIAVGTVVARPTDDAFRFPKDLWVRGETITILACWVLLAIYGVRPQFSKRDRPVLLFAGSAVAWTWITATLSTNRALGIPTALWATSVAFLLLTMYILARDRNRISDLWFLLIPGCLNALVAISQAGSHWNPFVFKPGTPLEQQITAFIGNPNELGSYLVLPVIVSAGLMIGVRRWRWLFAAVCLVCVSGLLASRTRTAMIAATAGVFCLTWIATRRRVFAAALIATASICMVMIVAIGGFITRDDLQRIRTVEGLNVALSNRVTPFLAAWDMFVQHPIVGVGPGGFKYWYFDYKIETERKHPTLFHTGEGFSNFGEAHDDHVQLLAEIGLPGYLLFLGILVFVASHSFREDGFDDVTRVARLLAFPVAAALFVLCLAQFPLHLASATLSFGFVLTTVVGWLRR